MGRTGHPAALLGAAAIVVATVGTTVAVTRAGVPVAKAATTLGAVKSAHLVSPSGVSFVARAGQRVPSNYVVRTAAEGSAELITRGRVVYVGGNHQPAAVAVVNGARQQLRTGTAVADAQHGPGMRLDVAGDALAIPDGAAAEVTRSVSITAGSLVGSNTMTNSSGRSLEIGHLRQVVVSGDALPAATTPFALSDTGPTAIVAEAIVVPELVRSDLALRDLAAGIDNSGPATASVVLAAWTGGTEALPAGTARSEQVLPIVMADSTSGWTNAEDRYKHIVSWRGQGGSWGVLLAMLSGNENAVASAYVNYARAHPGAHSGPSLQQLAGRTAPRGGGGTTPTPHHSPTPTSHPTAPPPTTPSKPTPKPTPTKGTVGKAVGDVQTVVDKVVGLVPKVLPNPLTSKTSGLVGGLLHH